MGSVKFAICNELNCDCHLYVTACSYELLHLWVQGGDDVLGDVLEIRNIEIFFLCFLICDFSF